MIDTAVKDGKTLFDFLNEEQLEEFTSRNADLGVMTALAGSLTFEDIAPLKRINPDIIGVRGMVCGGDRSSTIKPELVEKALNLIR